MKRLFPLLFTSLLVLASCSSPDIPKTDPVFDDDLSIAKRIHLAVDEELMEVLGFPDEMKQSISEIYVQRGYKAIWSNDSTLSKRGEKLSEYLLYPHALGVPENRLITNKKEDIAKELIVRELLLTAQLSQLRADLFHGIIDTATKGYKVIIPAEKMDFIRMTQQIDTVKDPATWFAKMGPKHPEYRTLAIANFKKHYKVKLSNITFEIPSLKEDSVACRHLSEEALIDKGYLLSSNRSEEAFWSAMEAFQADNGLKADGVIGTYTRKALDESPLHKANRAVLSLERWRWRSTFPERYIWINIPEYLLRAYYNDTLFTTHNIVVGKTDKQTPQLSSSIRRIVVYPYWKVPFSITSKEILPAMKRNAGYAARNHFRMYRNDVEIDPYAVNWKKIRENTFPYIVKQDPGVHNSLGVIKFEFPNKFDVYVHDTPSKGLFHTDVRSYSHGCMRCAQPDSLARFILTRDENEMTRDSLDTLLLRKNNFMIPLKTKIPIDVDYITVAVDLNGKFVYYTDIYERDEKYLKWMNLVPTVEKKKD